MGTVLAGEGSNIPIGSIEGAKPLLASVFHIGCLAVRERDTYTHFPLYCSSA